ncbi:UBX domain-containing protein 4 [Galendromus occidentalis]|uniref:UBX domain-containing protein 4 n=1 Tax=Galendromus occidentalis TaxID=34638 RepID=A0AAJ6QS18_9ACAR|nr:UBX domain-containing protein 4 [Galendromus occidentalis]
MEWYDGGITDAISAARDEDKLITVYVYGENPQSEQVASALNSVLLSSINPRVISLKLKQPSPELTQFAQVFPVLIVPSLYLICPHTGVALEVLAGPQQTETILDKITEVLNSRQAKPAEEASMADPTSPVVHAEEGAPAEQQAAKGEASAPPEPGPATPVEDKIDDVSGGDSSMISLEDKVQRVTRLIEIRREEKAQQEAEETRRREIERREALKNIQRIKREREDKEMKDLAVQKQKERDEEKRYRAQVQEQIKQDRLERQQRQQQNDDDRRKRMQEQQEEAERRKAQNSVSANIMFRLPDGSTVTRLFPADDDFVQVRNYIAGVKNLSNFSLALNFPRRVFEADCDQQTLRELQLAPSAVLLVIIKTQSGGAFSSGVVQSSSRGLWEMLAVPFKLVMSFFTSFLEGIFPPAPIAAPAAASTTEANRDAPGPSRKRSQTSGVRQRTPYQRNGNITRLNTSDESDNETNTWNGNSTQQM